MMALHRRGRPRKGLHHSDQGSTRAKGDRTYHLIVSFRTGEQPRADTLRAIEERICAGLGYGLRWKLRGRDARAGRGMELDA